MVASTYTWKCQNVCQLLIHANQIQYTTKCELTVFPFEDVDGSGGTVVLLAMVVRKGEGILLN